jgi:uncharacterized membrane protein YphA (DoxX/SURF4 family)
MENYKREKWTTLGLTFVRMAVGWHFLLEGFTKLFSQGWTAQPFLEGSNSFLAGFYHWIAASPELMKFVDILNIFGLIFIGLGLFLGLFTRWASIAGFLLLALYYFVYPPFGTSLMMQSEGTIYIVNKIFIEAAILLVFVFIKNSGFGLDKFIKYLQSVKVEKNHLSERTGLKTRRELMKNLATFPFLGVLGWGAFKSQQKYEVDVVSGATIQVKQVALSELKGELPKGNIGNHNISRLVAGGNLIGGWAHARDLIYASTLFKAYNTEKKVYETLMLAEQAGINTINIGFPSNPLLQKYKKMTGSKIKVISQVHPDMEASDYFVNINKAIDFGVDIIQIQGNWCDWLVRDNRIDVIEKMMDKIRSQGYTAGLASHTVDSLIVCEENGIIPDYYMKTMHHDQYWSAHPRENRIPFEVDGKNYLDHNRFHNNIFCLFPDRTVEFVNRAKVPVMGFKVLAAGAIQPEDGFRWAFENGADFICVGMFDFQIVHDINLTIDVLNSIPQRKREWYA